eukprot:5750300-Pleurochrysis_carterae.AAC.1
MFSQCSCVAQAVKTSCSAGVIWACDGGNVLRSCFARHCVGQEARRYRRSAAPVPMPMPRSRVIIREIHIYVY